MAEGNPDCAPLHPGYARCGRWAWRIKAGCEGVDEAPSQRFVMAGHSRPKDGVASARLCPGHPRLLSHECCKTWMPGTSPGMTGVTASLTPRRGLPRKAH